MKKIFLTIFFSLFILSSFLFSVNKIFAQSNNVNNSSNTQYANPYMMPNTASDVKPSLHTWMQSALLDSMTAMICSLSGFDPTTPDHKCLGIDSKSGKISYMPNNNGGLIGMVSFSMGNFYNLPFHTGDYSKYLSDNFGFATKAYAANCPANVGIGYCGLTPFIGLWAAFRNVSYLFLTVIFLIIGLAIMFRVKIDPRTVMSIENQLPKLIVGLVLITFSYAIAGLMIDFMYVLIYVVFNFMNAQTAALGVSLKGLQPVNFQGANPVEIVNSLRPGVIGGIFGVVSGIALPIGNILRNSLGISDQWSPLSWNIPGISSLINLGQIIAGAFNVNTGITTGEALVNFLSNIGAYFGMTQGASLGGQFANFTVTFLGIGGNASGAGAIAGGIAGAGLGYYLSELTLRYILPFLIAYLVFLIALLILLFRVWFNLLLAYAYIILDVLLAPFWILGGLIPGSELKFESWLRDLGANLLTFPVTIIMFLLASVLAQVADKSVDHVFIPPLVGIPVQSGQAMPIGTLLAVAIIFLIPSATSMVKEALKVKENKFGQQIGAGVGVGGGALTGAGQTVVGAALGNNWEYGENGQVQHLGFGGSIRQAIVGRFSGQHR